MTSGQKNAILKVVNREEGGAYDERQRGRKPQCAHDQAAALPGAYYAVAAEKSAGNYSPGAILLRALIV